MNREINIYTKDGKKIGSALRPISKLESDDIQCKRRFECKPKTMSLSFNMPQVSPAMRAIMNHTDDMYKQYAERLNSAIENIIRYHTGEPLLGEITCEELRKRNIRGQMFAENINPIKYETMDDGGTKITLESNFIGIVQGKEVIHLDGSRSPITEAMDERLRLIEEKRKQGYIVQKAVV